MTIKSERWEAVDFSLFVAEKMITEYNFVDTNLKWGRRGRMKKHPSKKNRDKAWKRFSKKMTSFAAFVLCATAFCIVIKYWYAENKALDTPDSNTRFGQAPYKIVVDAGHGGDDPGACGVIEEKNMTTATAEALWKWLEQDENYIPLGSRASFDTNATPMERAETASMQEADLLISIHGNSTANDQTVTGFECYPAVPGRTWHEESLTFARLLAAGMKEAGANLRGYGGVRYIYYTDDNQKQIAEVTHTEVREERSFTILEDVNCPAVLVEQCFVTSAEDVERFGNTKGCETAARIYYEAICAFFDTKPL